jgi:hypothetical protein
MRFNDITLEDGTKLEEPDVRIKPSAVLDTDKVVVGRGQLFATVIRDGRPIGFTVAPDDTRSDADYWRKNLERTGTVP